MVLLSRSRARADQLRRDHRAGRFDGPPGFASGSAHASPPELLLDRARARELHGSISDAGPAVVATELARHRGTFLTPAPPLARLDTTQPVPRLLAELAGALDARLAGDTAGMYGGDRRGGADEPHPDLA